LVDGGGAAAGLVLLEMAIGGGFMESLRAPK
jgi:hypothetical protein